MATDVKEQISETFIRHAMKAGMDKVTINAIVSDCNISRQAFYYYYQDIVDVARYTLRQKLRLTYHAGEEAENPEKAVQIFARELVRQFPVIATALNSRLRGEMEHLLIRELKDFFLAVFFRQNFGRGLDRRQIEFQAEFIGCGVAGYAIEHCNDCSFDTEEFSRMLWDMLRRAYGSE